MQILWIEAVCILFLIAITVSIILNADLFACAVVMSAFSFAAVLTYLIFGSPDVAFTEAVIGTMSTVFYAVALKKVDRHCKDQGINFTTRHQEDSQDPVDAMLRRDEEAEAAALAERSKAAINRWRRRRRETALTFIAVMLLAAIFCGISQYLPVIGSSDSAPNTHVSDYYIEYSEEDTASANIVSGTLADYRGYDTMFETSVMFVSGLVATMLLYTEVRNKMPKWNKAGKPKDHTYQD